ncbi:hypothetical protein [Rhizobium sp.]
MTNTKPKTPFYLIDTDSDFYRPFGVRLAICISVCVWAAIELYGGNGFWGVLSGAAAIYCIYVLFVAYKPPVKQEPVVRPDDPEDDEAPAQTVSSETTPDKKV